MLLVSGIPRSGTSLVTNILSKTANTISFSEPRFIQGIKAKSNHADEVAGYLSQMIQNLRNDIQTGRPVELRVHKDTAQPLDNYFNRTREVDGTVLIKNNSTYQEVALPKTRHTDKFVIKNNLLFTACMESLVKRFDMLFVIRDPIATLGSWNSLDIPVSRGVVKSGMKFSPSLKKMVDGSSLLERQIQIFDWFCYQYRSLENNACVVQYETLIERPDEQLKPYLASKNKITGLKNMNNNVFYSNDLKAEIINKINLMKPENLLHFYPM